MILYAFVTARSDFAVDVYLSREQAEAALREAVADEPDFEPLLDIIAIPPPWAETEELLLEVHPQ